MQIRNVTSAFVCIDRLDVDGTGQYRALTLAPGAEVTLFDLAASQSYELEKLINQGKLAVIGQSQPPDAPHGGATFPGMTIDPTPPTGGQVLTAASPTVGRWENPTSGGSGLVSVASSFTYQDVIAGVSGDPSVADLGAMFTLPPKAILMALNVDITTVFSGGQFNGVSTPLNLAAWGVYVGGVANTNISGIGTVMTQPNGPATPLLQSGGYASPIASLIGAQFQGFGVPVSDLTAGAATVTMVYIPIQ